MNNASDPQRSLIARWALFLFIFGLLAPFVLILLVGAFTGTRPPMRAAADAAPFAAALGAIAEVLALILGIIGRRHVAGKIAWIGATTLLGVVLIGGAIARSSIRLAEPGKTPDPPPPREKPEADRPRGTAPQSREPGETDIPAISGKIVFRNTKPTFVLGLTCLGQRPDGELESAQALLEGEGSYGEQSMHEQRVTTLSLDDSAGTITHRNPHRLPGWHLLLLRPASIRPLPGGGFQTIREGLYDWKWVELTDSAPQVIADLVVDPTVLGAVEVSTPDAPEDADVSYLPLRPDGQPPWREAHGAVGVGYAKIKDGRAVIPRLREGRYQLGLVGSFSLARRLLATREISVKAGATTQATLPRATTAPATGPTTLPAGAGEIPSRQNEVGKVLGAGRQLTLEVGNPASLTRLRKVPRR